MLHTTKFRCYGKRKFGFLRYQKNTVVIFIQSLTKKVTKRHPQSNRREITLRQTLHNLGSLRMKAGTSRSCWSYCS